MWRPRNETIQDLERQNAAKELICKTKICEAVDLSERLYEIDWAFHRGGRLICLAEYKWRNKQYETVILSLAKSERGCSLSRSTGVPFLFFVEWPDTCPHYIRIDGQKFPVRIGGNARGQNGDIEPVIHIPTEKFKSIK